VILVACRLVGTVLELRYAIVPTRVVDAVAAVAVAQAFASSVQRVATQHPPICACRFTGLVLVNALVVAKVISVHAGPVAGLAAVQAPFATAPESVLPLVLDTLLGPVNVSTGRVASRTLTVAGGAHVGAHAVTIPVGPCIVNTFLFSTGYHAVERTGPIALLSIVETQVSTGMIQILVILLNAHITAGHGSRSAIIITLIAIRYTFTMAVLEGVLPVYKAP